MLAVPRKNSAEKDLRGNFWAFIDQIGGPDYVACRQFGQIWKIYFEIVFFMLAKQD